jgi:hypothetical protein
MLPLLVLLQLQLVVVALAEHILDLVVMAEPVVLVDIVLQAVVTDLQEILNTVVDTVVMDPAAILTHTAVWVVVIIIWINTLVVAHPVELVAEHTLVDAWPAIVLTGLSQK